VRQALESPTQAKGRLERATREYFAGTWVWFRLEFRKTATGFVAKIGARMLVS
jgi:hypothetical protein